MKRARTPDEIEIARLVKDTALEVTVILQSLSPAEAMTTLSLINALVVSALPLEPKRTHDEAIDLMAKHAKGIIHEILTKGAFRS